MRVLIVSDIHSNLEAFEAVLSDAERQGGFDLVWFLGDLVGYNADPSACIALLRGLPGVAIAGNHDHAVVGKLNPDLFNGAARDAALWTTDKLSSEELEYLAGLPEVEQEGAFTLVHGSLRDPVMEYLLNPDAAMATFAPSGNAVLPGGGIRTIPWCGRKPATGPLVRCWTRIACRHSNRISG